MRNTLRLLLVVTLFSLTSLGGANPLIISTSGTFAISDVANGIATPGAAWTLSFAVDSQPAVNNAGLDGFDIPFSNFSFSAGNSSAPAPASIRFFGSANNGLFTLFFGPQAGVDLTSGNFVPELMLSGPQLFSGSTSAPALSPGTYSVSESLYTDNSNYDDQLAPGSVVDVASANAAVPEPGSLGLTTFVSLILIACGWCFRRCAVSPQIT
jgi:hypothetical protein